MVFKKIDLLWTTLKKYNFMLTSNLTDPHKAK